MERVACSDSCPGLFSQLKEVYLFGCNTLNAEALRARIGGDRAQPRRAGPFGRPTPSAAARVLGERHADSNRDRMRHIFKDVPVIYGFSSKAPLGPLGGAAARPLFPRRVTARSAADARARDCSGLFAPVR